MTNEFDRLRAANPATAATYAHGDLATVARRANTPTANTTTRFAQGFRLKIASAAMAATLLTSGGIVALQSGSSPLPVLSLGAVTSDSPTKSANHPTSGGQSDAKIAGGSSSTMRIWANYQYSASNNLSAAPGQAPVYKVSGDTDPKGLTIDLAKAVGIYDPAVAVKLTDSFGGIPMYEYVTDNGTISVTDTQNGANSWYFSSASTGVSPDDALNVNTITKKELSRWSSSVIDGLRFNATLGDATYAVYGDQGNASYAVLVDGLVTDMILSLSFDNTGTLLWANGNVATFDRVGNYPLISERDGVDNLSSNTPAAVTDQVAGSVASRDAVPSPGTNSDAGSDAVVEPPVIKVLITSATIQLSTQQMSDGSVWLIPTYWYSGTATNQDGTTMESTWSTIAVDPAYLKSSIRPAPVVY